MNLHFRTSELSNREHFRENNLGGAMSKKRNSEKTMDQKRAFKGLLSTIIYSIGLIVIYIFAWNVLDNPNIDGEVLPAWELFCQRLMWGLFTGSIIIVLFLYCDYFKEKKAEKEKRLRKLQKQAHKNNSDYGTSDKQKSTEQTNQANEGKMDIF